ncbi:Nell1 [Phodopus roborovskii]|uniref:Nell1 protein n=1 Tax=Phodopus roborovskii TaxID=109678 RepID=A0AAV0ACT1_PHORO|nr:Nell1 [Phodopus roborovskii]
MEAIVWLGSCNLMYVVGDFILFNSVLSQSPNHAAQAGLQLLNLPASYSPVKNNDIVKFTDKLIELEKNVIRSEVTQSQKGKHELGEFCGGGGERVRGARGTTRTWPTQSTDQGSWVHEGIRESCGGSHLDPFYHLNLWLLRACNLSHDCVFNSEGFPSQNAREMSVRAGCGEMCMCKDLRGRRSPLDCSVLLAETHIQGGLSQSHAGFPAISLAALSSCFECRITWYSSSKQDLTTLPCWPESHCGDRTGLKHSRIHLSLPPERTKRRLLAKNGHILRNNYVEEFYIDECAEGFVECHNHSRCVNLPGWYHCECRSGFHDDGTYSLSGESCIGVCGSQCCYGGNILINVSSSVCVCVYIDECALRTHTCWNDSACINLAGGFDCLCPSGPSCSGDCPHEGGLKHNGQVWVLREDRCSVCSCKDGKIFCRRTACDCQNPNVDLFCCPECDTRVTSQCLDQSGHKLYRSGDNWTQSCQQCRCLEGEADCWPLACPSLSCEYTAILEGECCPHCVSDPCLADNIAYDIRKTCLDSSGISRLSGAVWTMAGSPCTSCKCKNGRVCCSVDLECLENN